MRLSSRIFQPGDEIFINRLYKMITNIDRSKEEYKWEWQNTWDGQGNIYLLFDEDRKEGDQLIGQYSLIPTPFSVFGEYCLAGKTENCMSHLDYRGKGIYFPHEKKYFTDAQKKFKIFFTTTGNVGGAWVVRMKLGYFPLALWTVYYNYINIKHFQSNIEKKLKKLGIIAKYVSIIIKFVYLLHSKKCTYKLNTYEVRLVDENNIRLEEIEKLWDKNKKLYGISVERSSSYLKWRINDNPYHSHYYLLQYENDILIGYIIFYIDLDNMIRIIDILADRRDQKIFKNLLAQLKKYAKEHSINIVACSILQSDKKLKSLLRSSGFLSHKLVSIKYLFRKKKLVRDFYAYLPDEMNNKELRNINNWYITDLVKEGR